MRKYLIISALASLGIFLQAGSANDQHLCSFKYKVDDGKWIYDNDSGTTRSLARGYVDSFLEKKEAEAIKSGKSFESSQLFCSRQSR